MVRGTTDPKLFSATEENLHEFAVNVRRPVRPSLNPCRVAITLGTVFQAQKTALSCTEAVQASWASVGVVEQLPSLQGQMRLLLSAG